MGYQGRVLYWDERIGVGMIERRDNGEELEVRTSRYAPGRRPRSGNRVLYELAAETASGRPLATQVRFLMAGVQPRRRPQGLGRARLLFMLTPVGGAAVSSLWWSAPVADEARAPASAFAHGPSPPTAVAAGAAGVRARSGRTGRIGRGAVRGWGFPSGWKIAHAADAQPFPSVAA